jgi:hypothetical protein
MPSEIVKQDNNEVIVQFTLKLTGSMLKDEQALQDSINQAGKVAMVPVIKQFDTNGEPIRVNGVKHTVKDYSPQTYETPYGAVDVERHTYQTSKGGRAHVPVEVDGRMILNSTPRYAQMITGKYSRLGADALRQDLLENNGREVSRNYVKKLTDFVGSIAQCYESEWEYELPQFDRPVNSISIGLDGTSILLQDAGWREAMCGTIAFYDKTGKRMHTIYCAAAPEYGKDKFKDKLSREIMRIKEKYPDVIYIGLADGAKDNWSFLKKYTERLLNDFYHSIEYVGKAGSAIFGLGQKNKKYKDDWVEKWCHDLKHKQGTASRFLKEVEAQRANMAKTKSKNFIERDEELRKVVVYYTNNKKRMSYSVHTKNNLPIGSGVTEAACKTVIKHRICISGAKWKDGGVSCVLSLRALKLTEGRWQQFWDYIMRHRCTPY